MIVKVQLERKVRLPGKVRVRIERFCVRMFIACERTDMAWVYGICCCWQRRGDQICELRHMIRFSKPTVMATGTFRLSIHDANFFANWGYCKASHSHNAQLFLILCSTAVGRYFCAISCFPRGRQDYKALRPAATIVRGLFCVVHCTVVILYVDGSGLVRAKEAPSYRYVVFTPNPTADVIFHFPLHFLLNRWRNTCSLYGNNHIRCTCLVAAATVLEVDMSIVTCCWLFSCTVRTRNKCVLFKAKFISNVIRHLTPCAGACNLSALAVGCEWRFDKWN